MPPNTTAASKVAVDCMGAAMCVGSSPPSSAPAATTTITATATDINGSVNGPVKRVANGSVNGSVHSVANGSVNGPVNGLTNGSVNGSANGVANGSVNGPVNGLTNGSVNGSVHSVANGSVNGPVNGLANESVNGSANGVANGSVNGSVNGLTNGSVNGSANAVANGVAAKAVWVDKYNYTGHEIIWLNTIAISIFHVLTVILFFAALPRTGFLTGLWSIFLGAAGGFGVTGGVHRLWTHRSYKAKWPLRLLLMLCFCVSGQNSIFDWVRDHRVHHKFSETDADPHNVKRGFFFAHVGWLMLRKHPDVRRFGQQVDMSDVLRDPIAAFQIKYHTPLKLLMCFFIPIAVPIYFWGEHWFTSLAISGLTRYMLNLNFTWLVNSAAHMFGNKPYDRRIAPVENAAVSMVAMGEGWHNYHHVFPWDYKAAELAHINATLHLLNWFARIGWAYDLKSAPASLVERVARRWGDGSHEQWGTVPEIPEEAAQDPSILDALPAPDPEPLKDKAA